MDEQELEAIQLRKVLFLINEILVDLGFAKKSNMFLWLFTVIGGFIALRFTLLMHVMGQWLVLKIMDCPVEDVKHDALSGQIEYGVYFQI